MAIIRTLKKWLTKEVIYPQTVEQAIYDTNGVRLDNKLPFSFGIDQDGNYGYKKEGADSVIPFRMNGVHIERFSVADDTSIARTINTRLSRIDNIYVFLSSGYDLSKFAKGDNVRRIALISVNYDATGLINYGRISYSHPTNANAFSTANYDADNEQSRTREIMKDGGNVTLSGKVNGMQMFFTAGCEYTVVITGKE